MISINNVGVAFSGNDLFKDLSFVINPKDRIGLVGKNGVGKSTLLKLIAGAQQPTSGSVTVPTECTLGYLPQEINIDSDRSVLDETMQAFKELIDLEAEDVYIGEQLATRTDYESDDYLKLIERLNEVHQRLAVLDNSKKESQVSQVLLGLGFKEEEFTRPISTFSGGWQMRVELAKLILAQPSLLLLDEPTNHLDIESILWLEDYFKNYPGALLMISHDKMFLDNVTNRTIEIVFGRIYDYKVSYSKFFELREERLETQINAYENQQKYIAQQERFIERFKAKASKAKQAQSKMKQLEKIDRIEMDELDQSSIQFSFPPAPRSGDLVVGIGNVNKSYGPKHVLKNVDFKILRGQRVSFVGQNGMGKSTLIKLITGEENCEGEITIGHNVEVGYYAQIQEKSLNPEFTVLETIENEANTEQWANVSRIRGLLGTFLFGPNDMDKRVKVLSGGEKSRLALAKLLLKPVNLLILDEPTNHLDITSKEVLKDALIRYNGTLIVVSHDRDFLKDLTNITYEFKHQQVKEHIGSIDEFLAKHEHQHFRDFELAGPTKTPKDEPKKVEEKPKEADNKLNYEQRKERDKELRQVQNKISKAEKQIEELEARIEAFEAELALPETASDAKLTQELVFKHANAQKELDKKMAEWEQFNHELEQINQP